jgi:chromosome segregation ATPase
MTAEDHKDTRRHFDVVAECLESKIQQVAEGVAMNTERLDRVEAKLEAHDARFDRLDARMGAVEGEVASLRVETRNGFAELRALIESAHVVRRVAAAGRPLGRRSPRSR